MRYFANRKSQAITSWLSFILQQQAIKSIWNWKWFDKTSDSLSIFLQVKLLTRSCSAWRFSERASPSAIWEVRQVWMLVLMARFKKGLSSCRDQFSGSICRTRTASNTSPCRFRRSTAAISSSLLLQPSPPAAGEFSFLSRYTPRSRWNSCCW